MSINEWIEITEDLDSAQKKWEERVQKKLDAINNDTKLSAIEKSSARSRVRAEMAKSSPKLKHMKRLNTDSSPVHYDASGYYGSGRYNGD